jgi:hypothetical protein
VLLLLEPLRDPQKFAKREGEAEKHAMRRRNADIEAEYNAVTCVAVYMLLMSFSQKGIDKLRNHQEHVKMRNPDEEFVVSEGFDIGLSLFFSFLSFSPVLAFGFGSLSGVGFCFCFLFGSVDVVQGAFHQV